MRRILRFTKALFKYIIYGKRVPFEIYSMRISNCSKCDNLKKENWTCGICGCYIDKKAKMNTEKCPDRKW